MVFVKWVKVFLEDTIEDGYNVSNKLYYQVGALESEMGKINRIEINNHQILISCQNHTTNEDNYIAIPLKSNVLKFHYGGIIDSK